MESEILKPYPELHKIYLEYNQFLANYPIKETFADVAACKIFVKQETNKMGQEIIDKKEELGLQLEFKEIMLAASTFEVIHARECESIITGQNNLHDEI